MLELNDKIVSSNISRFQIIIHDTNNYDIAGILYNDSYGITLDFNGIKEFLGVLDEFFDYVNFPQASHEKRSFDEKKKDKPKPPHNMKKISAEELNDKNPAFILHVQFRQHSTWQGTLHWIAENKTKRFRSELEMIRLMAEALS